MTNKGFINRALVFMTAISLSVAVSPAGPNKKNNAPQTPGKGEKIYIPKDIKNLIQEGLGTKQGRQDFPLSIFKTYAFPAAQNSQAIFLFKAKNADLDFAPAESTAPIPQLEAQETAPDAAPSLESRMNLFLQFQQTENGVPVKIIREVYVPATFREDESGFDPEKEQWYSVGYPLPAGHYILALALTSLDLNKVSLVYQEFSLPDAAMLQEALDTTPLFFVKNMEGTEAVETKTEIHKGYIVYSLLHITPNVDDMIASGDSIEVFFYVYGTKPNDLQKNEIEVSFEVKQNDEIAIRWEPQIYDFAMISQPLPLKQTVLIKDEKGERKEIRDLPPGKYQLVVIIKDKVSGRTVEKTHEFEVK